MATDDRGPQISGVAGAFLALTTIAIVLRCYVRTFIVKSFGLDDWSAIFAWLFFVFFCIFAIIGVQHGSGQHASVLPDAEIPVGLKWWWACEPVYVLANMSLKLSISVMLLRISIIKTHKIIIYTVLTILELYSVVYFFLFVLQCVPSSYFWTRYTGGSGKCMDATITVKATYAFGAVSCWVDWTLATLPFFLVWSLQMNVRTKISVACILAMGAIASTATIIRMPYVKNLSNASDFLYATTDVAIWSCSETGLGITACCFATLRPLFKEFFSRSRLLGGTSSQNIGGGSSGWGRPQAGKYMRSGSRGGNDEEFDLRSDIGNGVGVQTVIGASGTENNELDRKPSKLGMGKGSEGQWGNSKSRLTDRSSEEDFNLGPEEMGVRKTVRITVGEVTPALSPRTEARDGPPFR